MSLIAVQSINIQVDADDIELEFVAKFHKHSIFATCMEMKAKFLDSM